MDKQEMFNIAVTKVYEQGRQCKGEYSCSYYGGPGVRCAIGWLLPEDLAIKYSGVGSVFELAAEVKNLSDYVGEDLEFLSQLQDCHDAAIGEDFRKSFMGLVKNFAHQHNLTLPILV